MQGASAEGLFRCCLSPRAAAQRPRDSTRRPPRHHWCRASRAIELESDQRPDRGARGWSAQRRPPRWQTPLPPRSSLSRDSWSLPATRRAHARIVRATRRAHARIIHDPRWAYAWVVHDARRAHTRIIHDPRWAHARVVHDARRAHTRIIHAARWAHTRIIHAARWA